MSYDLFNNLQEWGCVLDQVQKIREDGALDSHQEGLARLARYPFNWQLRETALRAIAELKRPTEEVLRIAVQIMADENNDLETRILAGNAVSSVLSNGHGTISDVARFAATECIRDLLARQEPPVLHSSARMWYQCVVSVPTPTGR
ncbi:MAG TPA: hypothetical protein VN442_12435 [Bryobacteraceae bacterium]|nr:hypothetical protein [Bryobacteraceae bacterium]